jgi:hypothetical protein
MTGECDARTPFSALTLTSAARCAVNVVPTAISDKLKPFLCLQGPSPSGWFRGRN